jgi:hypothetical protein
VSCIPWWLFINLGRKTLPIGVFLSKLLMSAGSKSSSHAAFEWFGL